MDSKFLDTSRHQTVFSCEAFGNRRIDVIGCGATGARVAIALAKLGISNVHVWDFDKVEAHNIANQPYSLENDIGSYKVDALASTVLKNTGLKLNVHNLKADGTELLGEVVFLLTDTMSSRKEIWKSGIRYKLRTKLMIETRMGVDEFRIYTVAPSNTSHVQKWEDTLYDDTEAEVSACGTTISVGPTADVLSGWAVWQFMQWFALENGAAGNLENEILVSLRSPGVICRKF